MPEDAAAADTPADASADASADAPAAAAEADAAEPAPTGDAAPLNLVVAKGSSLEIFVLSPDGTLVLVRLKLPS